jgi:oxygen-dependent protoporphyrinogen oxidase
LNAPVRALTRHGNQWRVTVGGPHGGEDARTFDAIVSTVPLHRLAAMDVETPVDLDPLSDVWYPPLRVLALGYPQDAIAHPLDGFGMLVPPIEDDLNILGTIFSSTLFPGRAPDDHVLLTTFVGGGRAPKQTTLDRSQLQALVESDLDRLLGVKGPPVFRRHIHWPNAIPQYSPGYAQIKDTLAELERTHPRLAFAGNYRQGVSVGDALDSGTNAAHRLLNRLAPAPSTPH